MRRGARWLAAWQIPYRIYFIRSNVRCEDLPIGRGADLGAGVLDPLVLEGVFRWPVHIVEDAEVAGKGSFARL